MTTYPEQEESLRSRPALRWTKKLPTEPGYYWFRREVPFESSGQIIVEIIHQAGEEGLTPPYVVSFESAYRSRPEDFQGEWAGPIEPPAR